jgi:hypothetical protein
MIEPGLEKTCYKLIKKKTGKKVDLLVGFFANLILGNENDNSRPLKIVCGVTEDSLWLIDQDSVQAIPLHDLQPKFDKPQTDSILNKFEFEFISSRQKFTIQSTDANGDCGFGLWLSMLAKRNGYSWWN